MISLNLKRKTVGKPAGAALEGERLVPVSCDGLLICASVISDGLPLFSANASLRTSRNSVPSCSAMDERRPLLESGTVLPDEIRQFWLARHQAHHRRRHTPDDHLSWRAIACGVCLGAVLCCVNMFFGLQTGFIALGSFASTLAGYSLFLVVHRFWPSVNKLTPAETVLVQTTAVACAAMPLSGGFVSMIPALRMLPDEGSSSDAALDQFIDAEPLVLQWWELFLWALPLGFLGVFFAIPLRTQARADMK